nr:hypothetical protein [Tanacetum cinerariifolium]
IVMANPNPENLNIPNEGVPKEDPHHLLDYEEEEDPKMDVEEEEPEEEPIEEPEPLPGHGDQFDAHLNPQPGNMNGWVDDDDDVEEEDNENEDRRYVVIRGLGRLSRRRVGLRAEKRLFESIWWNKRFYLEMVRKGAVPKPPTVDEGSERPRKMSKKSDGDEGTSDPRGPLM